ncbi:MAG: hypothetical protein OEY30_01875 [Candidatus Bathyarchaeota archaeon]|nr:hypothetical protein [Candidatus Bathyarchaeota archaeon]
MVQTVVEILSQENCLNCSSNCKGFCAHLRKNLKSTEIAQGIMKCREEGQDGFTRILSDWQLEAIKITFGKRTLVINMEGDLKEINKFCEEVGEVSNKYSIEVKFQ